MFLSEWEQPVCRAKVTIKERERERERERSLSILSKRVNSPRVMEKTKIKTKNIYARPFIGTPKSLGWVH